MVLVNLEEYHARGERLDQKLGDATIFLGVTIFQEVVVCQVRDIFLGKLRWVSFSTNLGFKVVMIRWLEVVVG